MDYRIIGVTMALLIIREAHQGADSINNLPLGFNVSKDEVLTPNQLILGQNYDKIHPANTALVGKITIMLPHVRSIVSSWFTRWNNIVIPQLCEIHCFLMVY